MKAMIIKDYGDREVLELRTVSIPQPQATQILVEVHATAINPVDIKLREGHLKDLLPMQFPRILGGDISGVVKAIGSKARRFKVGDAVFFSNPLDKDGGFAEFVAVEEDIVALKPQSLDHINTASLPVVALTAIQALRDFSGIKAGDKVLIHAGAGGVGSFAIQYAKLKGATVYTTATPDKFDHVRSLGADHVIDYRSEDFVDVAKRAGGMDIVFENVGGDNYVRSIQAVRNGGRVPSIVNPPDEASVRLSKEKGVKTDFMLLNGVAQDLQEIAQLIDVRKFKTKVFKTIALEELADGMDLLKSGKAFGKIVVDLKH